MKNLLSALFCAVVWAFFSGAVFAGEIGVVLMHGKWGTSLPQSPIGKLKSKLEVMGFIVVAPEMPWSRERYLDKSYEDSMMEIDAAVAELRAKGATRIVVGGQSMGANAALGYGARRDGLAGILAIAPGHVPEEWGSKFAGDIGKARRIVSDGKGAEMSTFSDVNQGESKQIKASAQAYLSWFDPAGPAVMPTNAQALRAPLLWVVGNDDPMYQKGESYAYGRVPANPKNAYVTIEANHMNAPMKGIKNVITWLKSL